ncbi:MAG: APC family permease, partial [Sulfobacillus sp.]|nr:APC family permease [Sulfobacillus sp.]
AYRRRLTRSLKDFVLAGLWPFIGGLFMFWVLFQSILSLPLTTLMIGLGALAVGIIPLGIYWSRGRAYFNRTAAETNAVL